MKKITIISFILFLVSIVVSTATVTTAMTLEVRSLYNDIVCIISFVTLILTALYSIPKILACYILNEES